MCGIIAVFLKNKRLQEKILEDSLLSLAHRGPDARNIWVAPEKNVGLGHARLSVISIHNGNQPLINNEHGIYAIVNGEFYDYKEIRAAYQKKGYQFTTETDSEIIIPLYLEYGSRLFEHLNGEFAFIIWDAKKQQFFAARDRFGIKPLYYAFDQGDFYAASEIKAFRPLGFKMEWDEIGVDNTLRGIPLQDYSCFKNVKQIRPGCFLTVTRDNITEHQYWDFTYLDNSIKMTDNEYIEIFREKLRLAIKRRLIADVPVGFYLSGGIDSSAVLALSSLMNTNLTAFNISFEDFEHDEYQYAKELSTHLGVNLLSVEVTSQDLADNFSKVVYHRESAFFQTNGIAKYLLSKFVRKAGYKVVLTGEGADETLAGYPPFKEDLVNHLDENTKHSIKDLINAQAKSFIYEGDYNNGEMNEVRGQLGYLPSLWKLSYEMAETIQGVYSEDFRTFSMSRSAMQKFIQNSSILKLKNVHPMNRSLYIFCKTFFPELVLSYLGDRVEMANSIEGRLPFLDLDLVNFNNQLPVHLKIKDLKEKYILYEAVQNIIPKRIYLREKKSITTPSAITNNLSKKSPLEVLMYDIFHSQGFKEFSLFDQMKVIKLLNSLKNLDPSNRRVPEFALTYALSLFFLKERFITQNDSRNLELNSI